MIYADSSFLVAFRVRHDTHHRSALRFYQIRQDEIWLWSPWHRVEVFNTVRQLTRHPEARRRLSSAEAKALAHYLDRDVRHERSHPGFSGGLIPFIALRR